MENAREKLVFEHFINNIENIRETWQIVEFFENELQKFRDEVGDSERNVAKEQEALKRIRAEYLELQDSIKSAKSELESLKNAPAKEMTPDSIDNLRKNLPLTPLEKVDIRLKDGIVVKANPASDVYGKDIAEKYLKSLWELKSFKARLIESDMERAKLRNEIKDLKAKIAQ